MKTMKTQKCGNGQNAKKMWNCSKRKNVKTVKRQTFENAQNEKFETGQRAKMWKCKNVKTV